MAMALGGTTAFADFAPPTCGTCSGSIYTLSYDAVGTDKFEITFSVDTSHYTGGGSLLDDVAFKVSSHKPTSVSLLSAPNGAANWTTFPGGISAGGCHERGSRFVCATANSLVFAASVPDGTYAWVFDVTTTGLFTAPLEASVKAHYTDSSGHKVGALLSENISLQPDPPSSVPEPNSVLLLPLALAGFIIFYFLTRRQRTVNP
jgi:hypothetical protein